MAHCFLWIGLQDNWQINQSSSEFWTCLTLTNLLEQDMNLVNLSHGNIPPSFNVPVITKCWFDVFAAGGRSGVLQGWSSWGWALLTSPAFPAYRTCTEAWSLPCSTESEEPACTSTARPDAPAARHWLLPTSFGSVQVTLSCLFVL